MLRPFLTGDILYEPEISALRYGLGYGGYVLNGFDISSISTLEITFNTGECVAGDGTYKEETSTTTVDITTASGNSNDRIDLIYYDISGEALAVEDGIPSANPNPPVLGDGSSDTNDVPIALAFMSAGESSIAESDVVDIRAIRSEPVIREDRAYYNSSDVYLYSDDGATQKIKLDGGDGSITASSVSLGTGELTAGSVNRASGTLTLEIGGTAEQSITSSATTFGGNVYLGSNGIGNDASALTFDTSDNATFAGNVYLGSNGIGNDGSALTFDTSENGSLAGNLTLTQSSATYLTIDPTDQSAYDSYIMFKNDGTQRGYIMMDNFEENMNFVTSTGTTISGQFDNSTNFAVAGQFSSGTCESLIHLPSLDIIRYCVTHLSGKHDRFGNPCMDLKSQHKQWPWLVYKKDWSKFREKEIDYNYNYFKEGDEDKYTYLDCLSSKSDLLYAAIYHLENRLIEIEKKIKVANI
jgi:hypothetical protein